MNDTIPFEVEMRAFQTVGEPVPIRVVDVPRAEIQGATISAVLEKIFFYGQNDFQNKPFPSISVGDVVRYSNGLRYQVEGIGYSEIEPGSGVRRRILEDNTLGEVIG